MTTTETIKTIDAIGTTETNQEINHSKICLAISLYTGDNQEDSIIIREGILSSDPEYIKFDATKIVKNKNDEIIFDEAFNEISDISDTEDIQREFDNDYQHEPYIHNYIYYSNYPNPKTFTTIFMINSMLILIGETITTIFKKQRNDLTDLIDKINLYMEELTYYDHEMWLLPTFLVASLNSPMHPFLAIQTLFNIHLYYTANEYIGFYDGLRFSSYVSSLFYHMFTNDLFGLICSITLFINYMIIKNIMHNWNR
jgi:hypothetical protein